MTKYEFVKQHCKIFPYKDKDIECYCITVKSLTGKRGEVFFADTEDECIKDMVSYLDKAYDNCTYDKLGLHTFLANAGWGDMDNKEEQYVLTPKGIFYICLHDARLIHDLDDKRLNEAWESFEELMNKCGYISE